MKIYIAMAETDDGNRIMENAYVSKKSAEKAAAAMIEDIGKGMHWLVTPIVEEMDLIDE